MKSRPDSRQKSEKKEPENNEDNLLGASGKEKLNAVIVSKSVSKVRSLIREKSAKSGKSITKFVKEDKSNTDVSKTGVKLHQLVDLGRKKSGRIKSGSQLSESTKTQVLKKFKGSRRDANITEKADKESKQNKNEPIMDEDLEKLSLSKKTSEMIDNEIGLKYISVIPPTPDEFSVKVRKLKSRDILNRKTFAVMKHASLNALPIPTNLLGPRYDKNGQIIPHSILGEVDTFVKQACIQQNNQTASWELNVDTRKTKKKKTGKFGDEVYQQHVNESKALKTFDTEMERRKLTHKRLADKLRRPIRDLLMYKSESYNEKAEKIRFIQHLLPKYNHQACFWTLPDRVGGRQIMETNTRSNRGYLPSPVISGDADSVLEKKGKTKMDTVCGWARNEYSQQKMKETQGVIKISNNVLFAELDLHGETVKSCDAQKKLNEKGDNKDGYKEVHFTLQRETTCKNQTDQSNAGPEKRTMSSLWQMLRSTGSDKFVHKYTRHDSKIMDVPALLIDDTVLCWKRMKNDCNHSNATQLDGEICKEVFVPIKAKVDEVVKGFAAIENCGKTVLRYFWMKAPANRTLPIPRPRRRYFYFLDNNGIILPNEVIYAPMLFRSKTPGYFTESWLLSTVPPLEGGAKVKFTFKGVATYMPDFSHQRKEIEDNLLRNQIETMCSSEVKSCIKNAVLKASLNLDRLKDDELDPLSEEEYFARNNPGLCYHGHIVRKLKQLEVSLVAENSMKIDACLNETHENSPLSVTNLLKMIHDLPDDEIDGDSVSKKQTLLWQLNKNISDLGFQPFVRMESDFQNKYCMMYTILQSSMDQFAEYASTVADKVGVIYKEERKTQENETKKGSKVKTKSRAGKGGKKTTGSPDPQAVVSAVAISPDSSHDAPVFSNAHKYRQIQAKKGDPKLSLYDEKVHIEMYRIISSSIDQMVNLFEGQ